MSAEVTNLDRLVGRLAAIAGAAHVKRAAELSVLDPGIDRHNFDAGLAVLPGSTAEVAAILKIAAEEGLAIVPQGGRTGLVRGSVSKPGDLIVMLSRMDKVGVVDACVADARGRSGHAALPRRGGSRRAWPLRRHRSGGARHGHHRRHDFHQCRWHPGLPPRRHAPACARDRGRARRWLRARRDDRRHQGRHGLRPEATLHRRRGYARHRDAGDPEARSRRAASRHRAHRGREHGTRGGDHAADRDAARHPARGGGSHVARLFPPHGRGAGHHTVRAVRRRAR